MKLKSPVRVPLSCIVQRLLLHPSFRDPPNNRFVLFSRRKYEEISVSNIIPRHNVQNYNLIKTFLDIYIYGSVEIKVYLRSEKLNLRADWADAIEYLICLSNRSFAGNNINEQYLSFVKLRTVFKIIFPLSALLFHNKFYFPHMNHLP